MATNDTIIRVLLIDDDEDDFLLTKDTLLSNGKGNFTLDWVSSFDEGEAALIERKYDVYLIDYLLSGRSGLEMLQSAVKNGIKSPIIMLTGKGDINIDFEAMHLGASDYLVKSEINHKELERAIRYAVEKAKATNQLHEQELKYRTLFQKSIDAIFIATPDEKFLDVNQSFLDLIGFDKISNSAELKVKDLFANSNDYLVYTKDLARTGFVRDMEAELCSVGGQKVSCMISAIELKDANGDLAGFQGIIRDITAQKRTENELRKAEKLAITGKLARTIAHEVRNPLTNISLSIDQLLSERPDDEQLAFYLNISLRNLQRINKLVTELLDSARPSELNLVDTNINDVLEQTMEFTKDRINLQNMKVIKEYGEGLIPFPIDKEKMQIALLNIIINAIEAMQPDKGELTIRTSQDKRICCVSIIDNGIGISDEYLGLLFDAFYTGKKNGMGLGLTTANNIILGHKGTIEVYSEPGKGTEFRLLFDTGQS